MNTKKYHMIIGTLLIIFGLFCTGISIFIYLKPEVKPDLNAMLNQKMQECHDFAVESGFLTERQNTGNVITSFIVKTKESSILDNPMPYVYKSSLLLSKCNNLKIDNYCVGSGCIEKHNRDFYIKIDRGTI